MAIIFCADLHISELTFKTCPQAKYDSIASLIPIFKKARDISVRLNEPVPVIMGGDIWDSTHVTPDLLQRFLDVRNKYKDVPLYYIDGNHDKVTPSWTSFIPGATHLTGEITTLPGGETVVGVDYQQVSERQAFFDSADNSADFLIGHQFVEKDGETKIASSMPLSTLKRFNKKKTVCLFGDIHTPMVINNRDTELYYPGPTNRRTIREPEGCYRVISKTDWGGSHQMANGYWYTRERIKVRGLYSLKLTEPLDIKSVPEVTKHILGFKEEIQPFVVLWSIRFDEDAIKELLLRVGDKVHLLFRRIGLVQDETEEGTDTAVASCAKEYAVKALREMPNVSEETKKLGEEMMLDEENFFENLAKKFGIEC